MIVARDPAYNLVVAPIAEEIQKQFFDLAPTPNWLPTTSRLFKVYSNQCCGKVPHQKLVHVVQPEKAALNKKSAPENGE